jgi:RNA polymerase sigma-70 factor, ECF subfamily
MVEWPATSNWIMSGTADARAETHTNTAEGLLVRAQRGDEDAFRLICEQYTRPLMSFIYKMVSDRAQAQELTQETFVRAYKHIGRLHDEAKLSSWLFGIARNVVRESLRENQRVASNVDLDAAADPADAGPLPDAQLWNKELRQAITKALATLPEERRLIFTLKVLQRRSYEEISEITGYSIIKLKTDVHRARAQMRRRLRNHLGGS